MTGPSTAAAGHSPEALAPPRGTAAPPRRLPALDGLRAVAVGGVLAYHLGAGWASGGYLGVDLFFVLSGFLITSLLVEERARTGSIDVVAFWGRRARRLLPALFVLLLAIASYVAVMARVGPPGWSAQVDLGGLRGDAVATLLYVANWHAIFAHQSYFARFALPSPLEHTWSLAIEEQFYLLWPAVLTGVLALARRSGKGPVGWRCVAGVLTAGGALVSAGLMAAWFRSGADPTRVYFGTDTRAFDLLAGATVALLVAGRPLPGRRAKAGLRAMSLTAVGGLALCWAIGGRGGMPAGWMFDGGFLACAAMAAVVVADAAQEEPGPLGALLSLGPLRWIGRISYGIYLWHWPVFVYVGPTLTGLRGAPLVVLRLAMTLGLASASYYLVECPIRRRRLTGWPRLAAVPAAAAGTAAAVLAATVPAVVVPSPPAAAAVAVVHPGEHVPGSGGTVGSAPVGLPPFGPSDPLRVTVLGDSVARAAEPAIAAALGATGAVRVTNATIDGFGLTTDTIWRRSLPKIVAADRSQVVLATWSWDDSCSARSTTPLEHHAVNVCALGEPGAYRRMLAAAVRLMLRHGAAAVVFLQFPTTGPVASATSLFRRADDRQRAEGEAAWDRIARSLTAAFPGRVLYLPVAPSVLHHDRFSVWLPPGSDPAAPLDAWVRVRTVDDVHLCPAGAARYADAVLADLTPLLGLPPADRTWPAGRWSSSPVYATPPDSCPADHPPG